MVLAANAFVIIRSVTEVRAAGETLTINAPVVFGSGYTISSGQFIDNANTAYFLGKLTESGWGLVWGSGEARSGRRAVRCHARKILLCRSGMGGRQHFPDAGKLRRIYL